MLFPWSRSNRRTFPVEPIKENWGEENLQLSQKTMRADQPHHHHHHHHYHYRPDHQIIITIIIMAIIVIIVIIVVTSHHICNMSFLAKKKHYQHNCCCVRKKKRANFSKVCWVCLDTRVSGPACKVNVVQCSKRVPAQCFLGGFPLEREEWCPRKAQYNLTLT